MADRKLRWGVLGCAGIAYRAHVPAMQQSLSSQFAAVASRDFEKARKWADEFGCRAIPGYEELLADPDIDAIYNPLPHGLHAEWTIKALHAGKHVLCEKPMALNAQQAQTMLDAARATGKLLFEAFMYRFNPRILQAVELVRSGRIGRVLLIRSAFSFELNRPNDHRWAVEHGGGALMDVGCYCVNISRLFANAEPARVSAMMELLPGTEQSGFPVDRSTTAVLDFGPVKATFSSRFDTSHDGQFCEVVGSTARLRLDRPFAAAQNPTIVIGDEVIDCPTANQYALQAEAFAQAALAGSTSVAGLTPDAADAVANMAVLDALRASAVSGASQAVQYQGTN
mgnify:CR=1 FL=1